MLSPCRVIVVTDSNTAQLRVERIRGIPIIGEVSIFTRSPNFAFTYEDVTIQPAVGAEHYAITSDTIRMDIGEVWMYTFVSSTITHYTCVVNT